jgi:hypothetical protein
VNEPPPGSQRPTSIKPPRTEFLGSTRGSILPATAEAAETVALLNGRARRRKVGADARRVRLCRELLELGALKLID